MTSREVRRDALGSGEIALLIRDTRSGAEVWLLDEAHVTEDMAVALQGILDALS